MRRLHLVGRITYADDVKYDAAESCYYYYNDRAVPLTTGETTTLNVTAAKLDPSDVTRWCTFAQRLQEPGLK